MCSHVCPWWAGYLLLIPFRRFRQNPKRILGPLIREGMTILEPGCGMGFWTLDAAQLAGPEGRVIAVDLQPSMLAALLRRAEKAGLRGRIEARECTKGTLGLETLEARVDLALVIFMAHEVPDAADLFRQVRRVLKPEGRLLLAEPILHVRAKAFRREIEAAEETGFQFERTVPFASGRAALLKTRPA